MDRADVRSRYRTIRRKFRNGVRAVPCTASRPCRVVFRIEAERCGWDRKRRRYETIDETETVATIEIPNWDWEPAPAVEEFEPEECAA